MPTWAWVVIAIAAALVLIGAIWSTFRARRTRALHERFGPEYDRVAADAPTRREAEAELREQRHEQFDITPLTEDQRDQYRSRWHEVQAEFVDDPQRAVARGDSLIQSVMRHRGYPVDDFDTRAGDLSVDHPQVVENYRAGHGIVVAYERGKAGTEELRRAFQHYRALFDDLVETREVATAK